MIAKTRCSKVCLCVTFLVGLSVLVGCSLLRSNRATPIIVTDGHLPDRDIVFQLSHYAASDKRIGFINADGSGLAFVAITHVPTIARVNPRPSWTSDGQLLLFPGNFGRGFVGITTQGERHDYARWMSRAAPLEQASVAVLLTAFDQSRYQIALFDLETSQIIRSFVIQDDDYPSIGTSALSGSLLVYRRWWKPDPETDPDRSIAYEIVLLDIDTGMRRTLARREGKDFERILENPAISPDGQWVVYTAADGLHLVRPDGSEDHVVVVLDVVREDEFGEWLDVYPPEASWSPDSRWLVYHRCMLPGQQRCYSEDQYAIFKLNIETGEEWLLVEGGINPYWRLTPSGAVE